MAFQKFVTGEFAGGLPYVHLGEGPSTLVIFPGMIDAFRSVASMPRYVAGLIPGAKLELLEDGGRGVFEERKREFDSAVINFLRD